MRGAMSGATRPVGTSRSFDVLGGPNQGASVPACGGHVVVLPVCAVPPVISQTGAWNAEDPFLLELPLDCARECRAAGMITPGHSCYFVGDRSLIACFHSGGFTQGTPICVLDVACLTGGRLRCASSRSHTRNGVRDFLPLDAARPFLAGQESLVQPPFTMFRPLRGAGRSPPVLRPPSRSRWARPEKPKE